jgi:alkylation response protein AidB-like acyl-CoA dehydrogenase
MACSAFGVAVTYAKERQAFGGSIFDQQAEGFRLAECAMRIEAARQLIWHAANLRDAGRPCLSGEWPPGVSTRGSRRTGREARTSSGSRYPTSRRAIRR